jgi:hypothetical protein
MKGLDISRSGLARHQELAVFSGRFVSVPWTNRELLAAQTLNNGKLSSAKLIRLSECGGNSFTWDGFIGGTSGLFALYNSAYRATPRFRPEERGPYEWAKGQPWPG